MGYYSILDSSPYDYIHSGQVEDLVKEIGLTKEEFWGMLYEKFDPLRELIEKEFETTEEFKTKQKQDEITTLYLAHKLSFEEKYGKGTYDYCYDVFRVLRNEEYLKRLEAEYKSQQQYKSSYYDNNSSNYNQSDYSQYFSNSATLSFKDSEKTIAEELIQAGYKALVKKYHPDLGGNKELFQNLGAVKEKLVKAI